jgi:S-DNA-T family DNA segregation ATPase FtsK/SpoIIIE
VASVTTALPAPPDALALADPIALPESVQELPPRPFPVLATIAPVLVSLVIWVITSSAFALVFAALGPVVAVASVADAKVQAGRHRRREADRFAQQCDAVGKRIAQAHAVERRELDAEEPDARGWAATGPESWWSSRPAELSLTLGRGRRASAVRLDAGPRRVDTDDRLHHLADAARWLDSAPVPAVPRVAIVGPAVLATAVARGYLLQLAAQLRPDAGSFLVGAPLPDDHWMLRLPHRIGVDESVPDGHIVWRDSSRTAVVAVRDRAEGDRSVSAVVDLTGSPTVSRNEDRRFRGPLAVEFVPLPLALEIAERLRAQADRLPTTVGAIPALVPFDELPTDEHAGGLRVPIGRSSGGRVVEVDLVTDGPHAVVGGTTGSGKSELLVAWVLGLAAHRSPREVVFLLVDFKGGASFRPLEALPHCVGTISDLGPATANRALASLRAEVRHRERALAELGARSIEESGGAFPRLVIVVDEFAALVTEQPELHALFADLAARGRSLGIHLVLCTQRPAGAVRDSVLANADIRISLRVNNRADSSSLVGTDAAAALPPTAPGRALLSIAGAEPVEVQTALAAPDDALDVISAWTSEPAPRRPWLEPLAERIPLEDLGGMGDLGDGGGIRIGVADRPDEQAQPVVVWRPEVDGHLLVLGASRSGKSVTLATISAQADGLVRVPADPEAAWDVVQGLASSVARGGRRRGAHEAPRTLVVIDDVDALVTRMPDEYGTAFTEALIAVLRSGPAAGVHAAIAAQRATSVVHQLTSLCDSRLVLRMANRQDHVMSGAPSESFDESAPPGRGVFRSHDVQVAWSASTAPGGAAPALVEDLRLEPGVAVAVVSTRPHAFAARARESRTAVIELGAGIRDAAAVFDSPRDDTRATVLLGDPAAWQAAWGAIPGLTGHAPIVFDNCSLADIRSLTRSRELPPLVLGGADVGLILGVDGFLRRGRVVGPEGCATPESAHIRRPNC